MSTPTSIQTNKLVANSGSAAPPSQSRVGAMASSIKDLGILEPIAVRRIGDCYEITPGGGMVRWLAAQQLGMDIVPIRVVQLDDNDSAAASLIVNMRRESIAPEEIVSNLERLIAEFGDNAAETVMGRLPELREVAAANPEFQDRINALLASCSIDSRL